MLYDVRRNTVRRPQSWLNGCHATNYLPWLTATAAQARQMATQAPAAAAGAYESAFAAVVPPPVIETNRAPVAVFGQNETVWVKPARQSPTPKPDYEQMWAQTPPPCTPRRRLGRCLRGDTVRVAAGLEGRGPRQSVLGVDRGARPHIGRWPGDLRHPRSAAGAVLVTGGLVRRFPFCGDVGFVKTELAVRADGRRCGSPEIP